MNCFSTTKYNAKANGPNEVVHNFIDQRIEIFYIQSKCHQKITDSHQKERLIDKNKKHYSDLIYKLRVPHDWLECLKPIQFASKIGKTRKTQFASHEVSLVCCQDYQSIR